MNCSLTYVDVLCRTKNETLSVQPRNPADVDIQPPWSLTSDGRRFLLVDDGANDKLVMFCTDENLER